MTDIWTDIVFLDSDWTEAVLGQGFDRGWTETGQRLDFCPITVQQPRLDEHQKFIPRS